jgi:hypothetical protein
MHKQIACPVCLFFTYCSDACYKLHFPKHKDTCIPYENTTIFDFASRTDAESDACPLTATHGPHLHTRVPHGHNVVDVMVALYKILQTLPANDNYRLDCKCNTLLTKMKAIDPYSMSVKINVFDSRPEAYTLFVSARCLRCKLPPAKRVVVKNVLLVLFAPRNTGKNVLCCIPFYAGYCSGSKVDTSQVEIINISSKALENIPKQMTLSIDLFEDKNRCKCKCRHLAGDVTANIHDCPIFTIVNDAWEFA